MAATKCSRFVQSNIYWRDRSRASHEPACRARCSLKCFPFSPLSNRTLFRFALSVSVPVYLYLSLQWFYSRRHCLGMAMI